MRKKKLGAALVALVAAGTSLLVTSSASGHGYTDQPLSRQKVCANTHSCGEIQWEPQSVEGPKGFPAGGPADGRICAGGNARFAELDDPRGGTGWPTTKLTGGQAYSFRWQFTARHATTDFRYYLTKQGWNPAQKLTRAALDTQPFLTVPFYGKQPPPTLSHEGTIPAGRTGHHLILAVWTIADTGNAFYACSDVQF